MNISDILEDSPNGYEIFAGQPADVDDAVRYYLMVIDQFSIEELPVEFGIVNYCLGKLLLGDRTAKGRQGEERARRIENALYHFNQASLVFNYKDYPTMFSIICIMMGRLFRERSALISHRSFLADRSTPQDSIQYGLDQIMDAFPILSISRAHVLEHAICSLEAGWLYVLQSEFLENFKDDMVREQAVTYLERTLSLMQILRDGSSKAPKKQRRSERGSSKEEVDATNVIVEVALPGDPSRRWNPITDDPKEFPSHIRLLLDGYSVNVIDGTATYLLGRLYQGWIPTSLPPDVPHQDDTGRVRRKKAAALSAEEKQQQLEQIELSNQEKAFEYLCACVRPKMLQNLNSLWGDAHHRAALILARYPRVVNPDYVDQATILAARKNVESRSDGLDYEGNSSDLHLQMATSHFSLALRCNALSRPERMNVHFHFAQTIISQLQMIIDSIPLGQSVTRSLSAHTDALDYIKSIEENLQEALQRVTPASTQTTDDAYLYYFSCLKISEYRMLEAACRPELKAVEREDFLRDAVEYLIDALLARPMNDNLDLHYICSLQMSQLLLAVKRYYAASKSYAKCLFVLSVLVNRSLFNPEVVQGKLNDEILRQVGQTLLAGARDVAWVKLHFGPVSLNERVTAGYASWSFEEMPSVKKRTSMIHQSSINSIDMEDNSKYKQSNMSMNAAGVGIADPHHHIQRETDEMSSVGQSSLVASSVLPAYKASPPKGVPPLNLPSLKSKKVFVSGDQMPNAKPPIQLRDTKKNVKAIGFAADVKVGDNSSSALALKKKPLPPTGPVPLFALGHNPEYATGDKSSAAVGQLSWDGSDGDSSGGGLMGVTKSYQYYSGPYGRRMRRRIPPIREMIAIDKANLAQYGLRKGKAAFLLPRHIRRPTKANPSASHERKDSNEEEAKNSAFASINGKNAPVVMNHRLRDRDSATAQKINELPDSKDENQIMNEGNEGSVNHSNHSSDDDLDDEDLKVDPSIALSVGADDDAGKDKTEGRARSKRVTAADVKMKARTGAVSQSKGSQHVTRHGSGQQQQRKHHLSAHQQFDNPIKKETTLAWFLSGFGGNKGKEQKERIAAKFKVTKQSQGRKKKGSTFTFLNPFDRPSTAGAAIKESGGATGISVDGGDEGVVTLSVSEGGGMWASTQCFFSFMVLSRQSRMQLVLRSSRYNLRKRLTRDCAELVVPPLSLKELAQKPFQELQVLFSSHSKIDHRLDDLENLLYFKISKMDNFLPFVTTVPVYLRDIQSYDDALLNGERLLLNLENENALQQFQSRKVREESERKKIISNTETSENQNGAAAAARGEQDRGRVDGLSGLGLGSGFGRGFGSFSFGAWKKKKFDYDSVSGTSSSMAELHLPDGEAEVAIKKAVLDKQQREEREEVAVGKMTLSLSQSLDGSNFLREAQQGSRDMLTKYLKEDECLLVWHLPIVSTQPLQVVLCWRGQSASAYGNLSAARGKKAMEENLEEVNRTSHQHRNRPTTSKRQRKKVGNVTADKRTASDAQEMGIVMELAKSDLDSSHLMQYIQGYLDALHASSAPLREAAVSDALRALSCALSLTEFLHMIPPHVQSLIICCPPSMRLIPWHLLLIEPPSHQPFFPSAGLPGVSSTSDATAEARSNEIHLLEKFCVRLGPTLSLFELNAEGGMSLRHSVGLHRMVAIDGEADHPDRSPGIRGTDLEVACASYTWSADPDDSHILQNESAVPRALQTGLFGNSKIADEDDFAKFKTDVFIRQNEAINHIKLPIATDDFSAALDKKTGVSSKDHRSSRSESGPVNESKKQIATTEAEESESSTDESDEEKRKMRAERKMMRKVQKANIEDVKALTMCRILHIAARKVPLQTLAREVQKGVEERRKSDTSEHLKEELIVPAAIELPQFDRLLTYRNPHMLEIIKARRRSVAQQDDDGRNTFSSTEIVRQLFMKNCALCVLSRFGLTDDIPQIRSTEWCDSNCEFIEALHFAGAKAVLHPLWSSVQQSGLTTLAHLIFLIRFYSTLPQHSKNPHSIVETCRRSQMWLRDATANDVIAFIHKAPIPAKARANIIEEMESYVAASLTGSQQKQKKQALRKLEETSMLASPGSTINHQSMDELTSQHLKQQHLLIKDDTSITTHGISTAGPSFILPAIPIAADGTSIGAFLDNQRGTDDTTVSAAPAVAKLGNRVGGEHKFFGHCLYWGAFVVSGIDGNVHHPDLTEDKDEGFEGHIPWDDEELNNMEFEASVLRMEGKISDAKELEKLIRELKIRRLKERMARARATGAMAGRGILDTLDYLDKKFLDQDSDEISVSDDSGEVRKRRRERDKNKPRESDSDEYDDADDISVPDNPPDKKNPVQPNPNMTQNSSPSSPYEALSRSPSRRFEPVPLNIGSMKAENIAYDKWKSKVGGLDMAVKSPILAKRRSARGGALTPGAGSRMGNADNFEYNMMKQVKHGNLPKDEEQDHDAKMEALYKKKEHTKKRLQEKARKRQNDDSEESDGSDVSKDEKMAGNRQQRRRADEESESDFESSSEDDSDESDGSGLYGRRKRMRKKKEARKKRRHQKTRFEKAVKEVRGGVRSYSTAVKQLTADVPNIELRGMLSRSKKQKKDDDDEDGTVDDDKCTIT